MPHWITMNSGGLRHHRSQRSDRLSRCTCDALSDAGGREYLARQANENPGAFMTLLGKVLPTQVTGDEGGPVTYAIITGVRRAAVEDEEQYGNC